MVTPFADHPDGFVVFGLLEPDSTFDIYKAFDRICDAFANIGGAHQHEAPRSTTGNDIWIDPEKLGLFVVLLDNVEGVDVAEDSRQLALELGEATEAAAVAQCSRRIEFGFQLPDPRGEIFPHFQRLLAVLQTFHGVIFLDPRNPATTLGGKFTPPPRRRK